jgi:hypothetical protein
VKKHETKEKNTVIEGQDLEENVFRAFVDILSLYFVAYVNAVHIRFQ